MSLCGGNKRMWASFEEDDFSPTKKLCRSFRHFSPLPSSIAPPPPPPAERILEPSGNDFDSTIRNVNHLPRMATVEKTASNLNGNTAPDEIPITGSEWVELIVREMSNSSNMDNARARACRVLEALEKTFVERARAESLQNFHKENLMLKEEVRKLVDKSVILKRGIRTLHGHKLEYDRRSQETLQLKKMASERDEELQKLTMENYELKLRLAREQQSKPMFGRFLPEVY